MNNNLAKWTNIGKIIIGLVGVIGCLFLFGGPASDAPLPEIDKFRDGPAMSFATSFSIVVLFLTIALVFIFFFMQLISNPKRTIMSIIGLVIALVVYLVFLAIGTSDTDQSLGLVESLKMNVSKSTINSTTAGIYTIFVGIIVAMVVILYSTVQRVLKR